MLRVGGRQTFCGDIFLPSFYWVHLPKFRDNKLDHLAYTEGKK